MKDNPEYLINFINCVKMHQCLWNSSLKEYSKREFTDQAWQQIAEQLHSPESECRERWKNIRCAFVRSLRLNQKGNNKIKKLYYLHDYLQFLLPHTNSKLSNEYSSILNTEQDHHSNFNHMAIEETSDEDSKINIISEEINNMNSNTIHRNNDRKHSLYVNNNETPIKKIKKEETNDIQCISYDDSFLSNNSHCLCKTDIDDSDIMFLKFILTDIKKLNEKCKRKFRKNVMDILDDLLEETECTNINKVPL